MMEPQTLKLLGVAVIASLSLSAYAGADETWRTDDGHIAWETDINGTAVFRLTGHNEMAPVIRLYLPDLPDRITRRGAHQGYWISAEGEGCAAQMTGPDGTSSNRWGRVVLTFDEAQFPSSWTAMIGRCFGEPQTMIRATAN